jgi:hypothetical protein
LGNDRATTSDRRIGDRFTWAGTARDPVGEPAELGRRGRFAAPTSFWWHNHLVNRRASNPFSDVAAVCGKDERGLHILRRRSEDGPIEAGVLQPLVEGKPLSGEVISLRRRDDVPFLFDVQTELSTPTSEAPASGQAQVATDSYRRGWDAIWGRASRSSAPN